MREKISVNGLLGFDIGISMSYAVFTVDVDRDANAPHPGRIGAISRSRDEDVSPRFESMVRGTRLLVELLEERGLKGTFFMEAEAARALSERTDIRGLLEGHEIACHGFQHEDLTGEDTGVPLSKDDVFFILEDASAIVEELFGHRPSGFRAPYLHVDADVLDAALEAGFKYDSSLTKDLSDGPVRPWLMPSGLVEVPLTTDKDSMGRRIHSYLWAMHEGKRAPQDYLRVMERSEGGVLVLATHSWHLVETISSGPLDEEGVKRGLDHLSAILDGATEMGMEFLTIEEILDRILGE